MPEFVTYGEVGRTTGLCILLEVCGVGCSEGNVLGRIPLKSVDMLSSDVLTAIRSSCLCSRRGFSNSPTGRGVEDADDEGTGGRGVGEGDVGESFIDEKLHLTDAFIIHSECLNRS